MNLRVEFRVARIDDPAPVDGDPLSGNRPVLGRNQLPLHFETEHASWSSDPYRLSVRPACCVDTIGIFVGRCQKTLVRGVRNDGELEVRPEGMRERQVSSRQL